MIVADVNVVAYLYLPGKYSKLAEGLLLRDAEWAVPRLWRSECRNVLSTYMRQGLLSLEAAVGIHTRAEALLADNEYDVPSLAVQFCDWQKRLDARRMTANTLRLPSIWT